MSIKIVSSDEKNVLKDFISLSYSDIYKNDKNYVPPLKMELKKTLDKRKNPFFEHGEACYFVAYKNGKPVGRISAHTNELHNKRYNDKVGFFGFFESINDPEVSNALFKKAEEYLAKKGMDTIRGPFSFSINDISGLLIDGFDYPPYILMGHNPKYYQKLLEDYGFKKVKDLYAWRYIPGDLSKPVLEIADAVRKHEGLVIREVSTKNLMRDVRIIVDIFNEAWSNNWGFVPFTENEILHFAKDLKQILVPELALIAEVNGEPAAIAITIPNVNELIKELYDSPPPFGWLKFLYRVILKKYTQARLVLLGIRKKFRGKTLGGLSVLLYVETHLRGVKLGIKEAELGWTLDDNTKINNGIMFMGGKIYKTYRIYEKPIEL